MEAETEIERESNTLVELFAGHFGTCRERQAGCRKLEFDESLIDLVSDVDLLLEVMPELSEKMLEEKWGFNKVSGFVNITKIVVESAQKTLKVLQAEMEGLKREIKTLKSIKKPQVQVSPLLPVSPDIDLLTITFFQEYDGGEANGLGVVLVDMMHPEDRSELVSLVQSGAKVEQIKERAAELLEQRKLLAVPA